MYTHTMFNLNNATKTFAINDSKMYLKQSFICLNYMLEFPSLKNLIAEYYIITFTCTCKHTTKS